MPTEKREKLRGHSRLKKAAIFLACVIVLLSVFNLASLYESGTIDVRLQNGWGFHSGYWRDDGADTFHEESYVLRIGPLEFDYNYNVSAGPLDNIQTIEVGKQRKVEIFAQHIDTKARKATVLLYQIWESPSLGHSIYSFGTLEGTTNGLQFELVSSADGDLIRVTERSKPGVVLILHDFSSKFDWPGTPLAAPKYWKINERMAESFIAQLARDNPSRNLVLGSSSRDKGIAVLRKQ